MFTFFLSFFNFHDKIFMFLIKKHHKFHFMVSHLKFLLFFQNFKFIIFFVNDIILKFQ